MLLDTCKLRHIGWGFFVRHIDTVAVLAAEDAVHIVAVLIATVVGLDTLNPYVYKAPSDYSDGAFQLLKEVPVFVRRKRGLQHK